MDSRFVDVPCHGEAHAAGDEDFTVGHRIEKCGVIVPAFAGEIRLLWSGDEGSFCLDPILDGHNHKAGKSAEMLVDIAPVIGRKRHCGVQNHVLDSSRTEYSQIQGRHPVQ